MGAREFVRSVGHANRLTAYGGVMTATGLGLFVFGEGNSDIYGTGLVGAGYAMDFVDGQVARNFDMKTVEGAKLDSFADKVKWGMNACYIGACEVARGNYLLPITLVASVAGDVASFLQRGKGQFGDFFRAVWSPEKCEKDGVLNSSVRANYWGKSKASLQMVGGVGYLASETFQNHMGKFSDTVNDNLSYGLGVTVAVTVAMCGVGIAKRVSTGKESLENRADMLPDKV